MVGNVSLNASMRTNLLSLQQISKLQDKTQLRLATGLKVNSAIDNPSSYYTATSLSNRANDLSLLLDAMGQGVQTIQAANEGLETAGELLSQMKAVVEQASTSSTIKVPGKAYFVDAVGANGAVVSTEQELRDAIASGKETICVYGNIDLGDISTGGGLYLKENQKLVGVNYFGNYGSKGMQFSSISATDSVADHAIIDIQKTGCLVSDLSINYENSVATGVAYAIRVSGTGVEATLSNLDIVAKFSDTNVYESSRSPISILNKAVVNIEKNININISGRQGWGIYIKDFSTCNINSNALINISTTNNFGYGFVIHDASVCNIASSAKIYLNTQNDIYVGLDRGQGPNILEIAAGAKIAFEKDGKTKWYEVNKDYKDINDSGTVKWIKADNVETVLNVSETSAWEIPTDIKSEEAQKHAEQEAKEQKEREAYQKQFNEALSQYDMLINDCSYKGVNLLKEGVLKINFNEDKSSNLLISGVNVTSENLGLEIAEWKTQSDVQTTLDKIQEAKEKLRAAASELGNYYSIITTREDFTNSLINVLEEGADKLTLADMNEESANMLSLQTQQQLAINSLSLSSQASQSILRLF